MTTLPLAMIEFDPKSRRNDNRWTDEPDPLWLLTLDELATVPEGSVLTSINGDTKVVGMDYIDDDTRFGYTAYGFRDSQLPARSSQPPIT